MAEPGRCFSTATALFTAVTSAMSDRRGRSQRSKFRTPVSPIALRFQWGTIRCWFSRRSNRRWLAGFTSIGLACGEVSSVFGLVHRLVRGNQSAIRIHAALAECSAATQRHGVTGYRISAVPRLDLMLQTLDRIDCLLLIDIYQQHQEFIAAVAADDIRGAKSLLQQRRHFLKNAIAHHVP